MTNTVFIALHDLRHQMRQGSTLLWIFVMPPIFFYFIGTVTGGFSSGVSGGLARPLVVESVSPGFLKDQIDARLRENNFVPQWRGDAAVVAADGVARPRRLLTLPEDLSERILAGEQVEARYQTAASSISRDYEAIQIRRSFYTVLADIVVAGARSEKPLSEEGLLALNDEPRIWRLEVSPAGQREKIPSGFEQAIPGILVMFTLLVLLTSGAAMLAIERAEGLLRRLASAPISRTEIVWGKWGGRMALATMQIGAALAVGTVLFKMQWGPNFGMVMVVLAAWAAFCASAGLLLGSLAKTEAQASGLGVLIANLLAALGGCWWPIEVTPEWMQAVQKILPTGWTMDALHKLISFQAGAASVLPNIAALMAGTLVLGMIAVRRFRYV